MKRTNKTLVAVLAGSLLLGSAGAALAFGPGKGGCDRGGFGANPMHTVMRLDNLTDEQRSKLDKLQLEQREAMRKQMDTMRDARIELHEAIDKGADAATIRTLAEKNSAFMTSMIVARAEMRQKIDAILTPQQRQQLQQRNERRNDDNSGMGPRHGW